MCWNIDISSSVFRALIPEVPTLCGSATVTPFAEIVAGADSNGNEGLWAPHDSSFTNPQCINLFRCHRRNRTSTRITRDVPAGSHVYAANIRWQCKVEILARLNAYLGMIFCHLWGWFSPEPLSVFYIRIQNFNFIVLPTGLEPVISAVKGRRPNQLDDGSIASNLIWSVLLIDSCCDLNSYLSWMEHYPE